LKIKQLKLFIAYIYFFIINFMLSENIRKSWKNFWLSKNHKELKPSPLVPQ